MRQGLWWLWDCKWSREKFATLQIYVFRVGLWPWWWILPRQLAQSPLRSGWKWKKLNSSSASEPNRTEPRLRPFVSRTCGPTRGSELITNRIQNCKLSWFCFCMINEIQMKSPYARSLRSLARLRRLSLIMSLDSSLLRMFRVIISKFARSGESFLHKSAYKLH